MAPFLLSLTLFAAWWLVGTGLLAGVRADLTSLRTALTAPALGSAATVLPLFLASSAGVSMQYGGPVVFTALLLGALVLVATRRPRLPRGTRPVVAACVGAGLLSAWPFFHFGFSWIGNANSDMTLYVLSATRLVHHGLLSAVDPAGLSGNRDFAGLTGSLYAQGGRPGSDIILAALSSVIGRPAYQLYMPLTVAVNLVATSSVAALTMQAARRWWAALLAASLFAVSPLATYALIQQLLPQLWGLALACSLLALLLRRDLHQAGGARMRDVIPVGVIAAALSVVYMEAASTLVLAYALYVFVLIAKRQIALRATFLHVWLPALAIVLIVLNSFSRRDVDYLKLQVVHGAHAAGNPPLFGYAMVPSALAAVVGLRTWNPSSTSSIVGFSIVVAALILAAVLFGVGATIWRGQAAPLALAASALLAVLLIIRVSDFGLFKLAMFVQPFLAASIAVWLSMLDRRFLVPLATFVAVVVAAQLPVQFRYVHGSLDPTDLRHASTAGLLPAFEHFFTRSTSPVISVTDNPVLAKLEGSVAGSKALYFIGNNDFGAKWQKRTFKLSDAPGSTTSFEDNKDASSLLAAGRCNLVLATGSQNIVNRRGLPEGSPDLVFRSCTSVQDVLVFTGSTHGVGFYDFGAKTRKDVTLFQLEPDYFYRGRTISGVGRYLLFHVLRSEPEARLELWISTTARAASGRRLPPAVAVGATPSPFPIVGRGSARVFSAPLEPELIGGQPYVMLDLGRDGTLTATKRSLIQGLFARNVAIDSRFLTAYARNISLVSGNTYRKLDAPSSLQHFPQDLANEDLEYSGIYEDGWIGAHSYAVLASGGAENLLIRADVPSLAGQHLDVLVDGKRVASKDVDAGELTLRVPVPASESRRRVELVWAGEIRLKGDGRAAAAHLTYLGFVRAPIQLRRFPADLANPGLVYSGIYADGWLRRNSRVDLAGGAPANLVVRVLVPAQKLTQHLRVVVNGRPVASKSVGAGQLELRLPVPATSALRRVDLRWSRTSAIAPNDPRHAAALLESIRLVPRRSP
jgi:hypothetical protein